MSFLCLLLFAAILVGTDGQVGPIGETENFLNGNHSTRLFLTKRDLVPYLNKEKVKAEVKTKFERIENVISKKYPGGQECKDMFDVKMKMMLDLAEGGKLITNSLDIDDNAPAPNGSDSICFVPYGASAQNKRSRYLGKRSTCTNLPSTGQTNGDIGKRGTLTDLSTTIQQTIDNIGKRGWIIELGLLTDLATTIQTTIYNIDNILHPVDKRGIIKDEANKRLNFLIDMGAARGFSNIETLVSHKYPSNFKCETMLDVKLKMAYDLASGGVLVTESPIPDDDPAPGEICFASYRDSLAVGKRATTCNIRTRTARQANFNLDEVRTLALKVQKLVSDIKEVINFDGVTKNLKNNWPFL